MGDRFQLGVGVGHWVLENSEDAALIQKHFEILTPENCMKPQGIQPAEGAWAFEATDRFMEFVREHDLKAVGHCLVWAKDDRTDPWMMEEDGVPVSKETLLGRIQTHVDTVVGRYADAVTMWDVVNEAVSDGDGETLLRDSVYSRTTGMDFMVTAFQAARAQDPDALLIYNDYNGHKPEKRKKLLAFLQQLKERGAPVDAYGMQGHFELGDDSLAQLRETFDALRVLGLKVVVSELDIDVVTRGRWWADGGRHRPFLTNYDPYATGLYDELQRQLSWEYVALFHLFVEYSDIIERVSFWNLHDGHSWLNSFPWKRTNHPLLFDRERQPKPCFHAVQSFLRSGDRPPRPHRAMPRGDANSKKAHEQLLEKAKQGTIDVYFQGDSITRRWGATDYPELLAHWNTHFHGWNAANFAWGGDATWNILWRMQHGELEGVAPKVVVLQAGTNNLPWNGSANETAIDEVCHGLEAIMATFRRQTPEAIILLTGLFPRTQNLALAPAINEINERISKLSDGERIRYININAQIGDEDGRLLPGMSSDGLHLEAPAYDIWAAALKPHLTEILGPPTPEDQAPPATGNPAAASQE